MIAHLYKKEYIYKYIRLINHEINYNTFITSLYCDTPYNHHLVVSLGAFEFTVIVEDGGMIMLTPLGILSMTVSD